MASPELRSDLTEIQEECVSALELALGNLAVSIGNCSRAGLEPAAAFRMAGVDVPPFADGMLNTALAGFTSGT